MNYPVWVVPIAGGGLLIATVAIVHVFISQFAVGSGIFLAIAGAKALREGDEGLRSYLYAYTRMLVIVSLLFGAVTGVGIWFTIGLVSPQATSVLIRTFVWGWAIEWCFFLLETSALLLYYYGWNRLDRRTHQRFAWVYAVSSYLTLAVINGIVAFMLTPGQWPATQRFWDGLFNPGYLPSLALRTAVSLTLAGLYALVTAVRMRPGVLRDKLVHWTSGWTLFSFAALPLGAAWYLAVIPARARDLVFGGAAPVSIMFLLSVAVSILLLVAAYAGPWRSPTKTSGALVALLLALGLMATGSTEWVREGIRKPWVIYGYLYTNGVFAADSTRWQNASVLQAAKWVLVRDTRDDPLAAGQEIFRTQCMSCHTVGGYNGLRPLVGGWDQAFTAYQVQHLHRLKPYMPPFHGTDEERQALAGFLASLNGIR